MRWLAFGAGMLVGGAFLVCRARHRWLERAALKTQVEIEMRGYRYRFEGHDESLQQRTQKRRQAAEAIRARAAKVESGAKVSDVLRMVK